MLEYAEKRYTLKILPATRARKVEHVQLYSRENF